MGVMRCFRRGCENIMCDRCSNEHGYICHDCYKELVDSGEETNVASFMSTPPRGAINKESAEARFNIEFPFLNRG